MWYSSHTDIFPIHAYVYVQKSWKRPCPGFNPAAPLNTTGKPHSWFKNGKTDFHHWPLSLVVCKKMSAYVIWNLTFFSLFVNIRWQNFKEFFRLKCH